MTLLSLASKQIWPQVLAVAHLKPTRLILLHSEDAQESKSPAQRLKRFFDRSALVAKGKTRLETIPHDDFGAIERCLDELIPKHELNLHDCLLNFTGGNKLMAVAAFRWAAKRSVRSFYLERGNQLTRFEPRDGDLLTHTEQLDGHLTDNLNPVGLLKCQLDASEIEREGETLTLNQHGIELTDEAFLGRAENGNPLTEYLEIVGSADKESKPGDLLELNTAAVLLKLGVRKVQRSLRLKVKSAVGVATRRPHAEIDLLFNWDGHLWLVDCKDQVSNEDIMAALKHELPSGLSPGALNLLDRVGSVFKIGQTKALKEDMLAVREAGGLLGQVVCVRKSNLPDEVLQFARHNRIAVVAKAKLVEQLSSLLNPRRPATTVELKELAKLISSKAP